MRPPAEESSGRSARAWPARIAIPIAVLVIGGLASAALLRGPAFPTSSPAPIRLPVVEVIEAVPQQIRGFVRSQGTVEPRAEIDLAAEIAGRVQFVSSSLEPGGFFSDGDVLVQLDDRDAMLDLRQAEAKAKAASAEFSLAEEELERMRALSSRNAVSAVSFSTATHRHEIAAAARSEAQALREKAQLKLDKTRIRAPFDGRVRSKSVAEGQWLGAGAAMARVYATDYAELRLPVRLSDFLLLGAPLASIDGELSRSVTVGADIARRRHQWTGSIVHAEGAISAETRMLNLVARLEDPYGLREGSTAAQPLLAGLFVDARIAGRLMSGVYVLPDSALAHSSEVFLVDGDGQVQRRSIEILQRADGAVLVGGGLEPGDLVCRSAAPLAEGLRVEPRRSEWVPNAFAAAGRGS